MTDRAIEALAAIARNELRRRDADLGPYKPAAERIVAATIRETIALLADWYELDDSQPPGFRGEPSEDSPLGKLPE